MSRLSEEWKDGRVLALNILESGTNWAYYQKLGIKQTPVFILFDAQGREIKRWGGSVPKRDELTAVSAMQ